jgi:hypothetical protein
MKIAFLGVRVPGHLNPTTALGRQFRRVTMKLSFLIRQVPAAYPLFLGSRRTMLTKTPDK